MLLMRNQLSAELLEIMMEILLVLMWRYSMSQMDLSMSSQVLSRKLNQMVIGKWNGIQEY